MSEGWIGRLETALSQGTAEDGDQVLRGERPPLMDRTATRALIAPMLAMLTWAAAILREMITHTSVDPLALALRLLALGLTLRVALLGVELWRRARVWQSAGGYGLALAPEGLLYRTPRADYVVPREHVVGIVERGRWQEREPGRRWNVVYVVTVPSSGRTHLELPPVFDVTPGRLAERLMAWRGAWPEVEERDWPPPHDLASKVYDEAASGQRPEGTAVIRHGWGWLRRGPYATVLLAVAATDGLLRAGPAAWALIDPPLWAALATTLATVPLVWAWITRRQIAPRRGLAMVLTPSELLVRTRAGILRTRWQDLLRTTIDARKAWSVLEGYHQARELVLRRSDGTPIRDQEAFLGVPVEVAQLLCDAYRKRVLPLESVTR